MNSQKTHILSYTHNELKDLFQQYGLKRYRAIQVLEWVYSKNFDFSLMSNISKEDIALLTDNFTLELPEIEKNLFHKTEQ